MPATYRADAKRTLKDLAIGALLGVSIALLFSLADGLAAGDNLPSVPIVALVGVAVGLVVARVVNAVRSAT